MLVAQTHVFNVMNSTKLTSYQEPTQILKNQGKFISQKVRKRRSGKKQQQLKVETS